MSKVIRKISEDTYQKMARTVHSLLEEERGTAETPKLDKLWDNGWDMRAAETVEGVLDQIKNGGIRNRVNSHDWELRFVDDDRLFMIWGTVPPLAYGTAGTPDYCLEEAVNWLAQDIHTMILEEVAAVNEKMDDGMSEVEAIGIHYDWIPRLRNAGWTDENLDTVDGVKDALWEGVFEPDD